ncbi:flagellar biosynthesis regulator FlaF (plasmid) [Paroceanicella profunda]|uniref:Flagellar biosynthesis regulator FlaF n=1 Tax=Paroceanicella profunda TaxID=2579971 RepID=A0A5B8G6M6_9RHOB|nr:flagellar biosynthesis regulator FlaF [Paroceanicella profunda]QDL94773.1 flagellar biosynthesis regulator FlaF [Paroceanicella profunda]
MNSAAFARTGYDSAAPAQGTPRRTEYRAFAQATHRLSRAGQTDPLDFPRLAEAVSENQRLWILLAADVADSANGLPAPLRAQIFYLAEFTRLHSRKILDGTATVAALIDINTAVMRGLRGGTESA